MSLKFDHITPLLLELHWLRLAERIDYKVTGSASLVPQWFGAGVSPCEFRLVADTESRQRLRSASTAELIIPRVRRAIIGGRAVPVAACIEYSSVKRDVIV